MIIPIVVPNASWVTVSITGPLVHRCPYVSEVDNGTVDITWLTDSQTLELHSLRAWLDTFSTREISHEDITEEIRSTLFARPGITNVRVTTRWYTAGFDVSASGAP